MKTAAAAKLFDMAPAYRFKLLHVHLFDAY